MGFTSIIKNTSGLLERSIVNATQAVRETDIDEEMNAELGRLQETLQGTATTISGSAVDQSEVFEVEDNTLECAAESHLTTDEEREEGDGDGDVAVLEQQYFHI